jgi:hypothetical protein
MREKEHQLSQGSQASPARPCGRRNVEMNMYDEDDIKMTVLA